MKSDKSQTHLGATTMSTLVLYNYYKIVSHQDPVVFIKSLYENGINNMGLCHFALKDKSQNSRVEHFTGGCDNEGGSTANQFYFDTKNYIILAEPGRHNGPDTQLPTGVLPVEFL